MELPLEEQAEMNPTPSKHHKKVKVFNPVDGEVSEVDEGVCELLTILWEQGIRTYASCENVKGKVWVEMDLRDYKRLVTTAKSLNKKLFDLLGEKVKAVIDFDDTEIDATVANPVVVDYITWVVDLIFSPKYKDTLVQLLRETYGLDVTLTVPSL
jgi:hypothetical protein